MNREIMPAPSFAAVPGSYHAELSSDQLDTQGQLLDWVISFAFETLGASRLDLRVTLPQATTTAQDIMAKES
jgi:hypothetical protein